MSLAGPLLRQRWLGYLASAVGALLAFAALVNLAGGFGSFDTGTSHRSTARTAIAAKDDTPWYAPPQVPAMHNVYYIVESDTHAQALIRGEEAMPPSLDPAPTKTVILIAETEIDLNALQENLMSTSIVYYKAGSPFTYELINLRR
jgi:hypothetical protein